MKDLKQIRFSCAMLGLIFCLGPSSASAEEKKEPAVMAEKKEVPPQIRELQNQQQKLRLDYEKNKNDLHAQLKNALKNFKEEEGQPTIQDVVKENNKKQEELRVSFQDALRKLQAQERKLRLGRESVERPELGGGKQGEVYKKALTEKEKRLEFQKRRQAQDQILQKDRQQDNQQRSLPKPSALPRSPSPSSTAPSTTGTGF